MEVMEAEAALATSKAAVAAPVSVDLVAMPEAAMVATEGACNLCSNSSSMLMVVMVVDN